MDLSHSQSSLRQIVHASLSGPTREWLEEQLGELRTNSRHRKLYLAYSKLNAQVTAGEVRTEDARGAVVDYLRQQAVTPLELARLHLLVEVLNADADHWQPAVERLIEVADTGELVTFLKYLSLLPHPEQYAGAAVEALRTNIATVFDAISQGNPYPADHFNDQQWNQMFLKAAFMQRDLAGMVRIDDRANDDLARIISDYAHERWAAGRDVDPLFWRPTTRFLEGALLKDMERLLESDDPRENKAGALCCYRSEREEARSLLERYPDLDRAVTAGQFAWNDL